MTGERTLTVVDDLDVGSPQAGEVKVRVRWCSACHSDLHVYDGVTPPTLPTVLGHEAAGVVQTIGLGVTSVAVGDHVVLSMIGPCGTCPPCLHGAPMACRNSGGRGGVLADGHTRMTHRGREVTRALRVGGFAEHTVVPERSVVRVPSDMPLDLASVVGCSVQTGFGAVVNIAAVAPGSAVGVIGLGAVGISAVQAARIVGATHIVAVDPLPNRRDLAVKLGASLALSPDEATEARIRSEVGDSMLDVAIDTVTRPQTTRQAISAVGPRGTVVVVGVAPPGQNLGIDSADIVLSQKRVVGCYLGNCIPLRDIPALLRLYRSGQLDLASMVTMRRTLEDLDGAFDDLRAGVGLRTAVEI